MATATKAHNQKSLAVFFSLSEDQILVEGSTKGFEHFVLEKRFPFAENCDEFWVVIPKLLKSNFKPINERFRFLGLFDLICLAKPGPIRIFSMFFKTLGNQKTKVYSKKVRGKKRVRRLLSDLLITTSITNLNKRNFDVSFLVGTNSFLSSGLPTIFALNTPKAHRVIIWYSINSLPITRRGEEWKNYLPADFVVEVDEHYVWDQYQKADLESRGIARASVKRSMVFIPENTQRRISQRAPSFKVSYFDVTPTQAHEDTFYSTDGSIRTLEELIRQLNSIVSEGPGEWELYLKPKRFYAAGHSKPYIQFVERCVSRGQLKWLSPKSNLYEVVRQSKLVLAPPFSSPVIISRELGVPCAFYFLPEPEWLLPRNHHGVEVISTVPELQNFLSLLGKRL